MPEEKSSPRIEALDLARGLAVLFMMWVHVKEEWATEAAQATLWGKAVEFLGTAPAAPVFMFLMGASVAFSKRNDPWSLARRGGAILLLAYALSVVRGSIPVWIGLRLGVVQLADIEPYTPWNLLWNVDILEFAGPALAILGLARLAPLWSWVVAAGAVVLVAPYLWGIETGIRVVDGVCANLWGTGKLVSFPMFPWLAWPLLGMAWGQGLTRARDEGRVFLVTATGGVALLAVTSPFLGDQAALLLGNHWRMPPVGTAWMLGFVGAWLGLWRWGGSRLPAPVKRILVFWSRYVTRIYVIQWLLIGWGCGAVGYRALGVPGAILGQVGVPILAHLGTLGVNRVWRRP